MNQAPILVAEDDDDDYFFIEEGLKKAGCPVPILRVKDGVELMEYLCRRGEFARSEAPRPALILLDLDMPRMHGREALREIKSDEALATIPVIVLTGYAMVEELSRLYRVNTRAIIRKPATRAHFLEMVAALGRAS